MNKIRVGFIPCHREPFDENWAGQLRKRCLDAASAVPGLEIVAPDATVTAGGLVRNDDDAEKVIKLFQEAGIDGLLVGTMTFGDEVSALAVAETFHNLPILLFGTKEDAITEQGCRRSDSFCGTLSISSGLYRRKIPFIFGGIVFPEEEAFTAVLQDFARVCSITRGFLGGRLGLVGPRPERFETCIFSEDALMRKFGQRVVPTSLPDLMTLVDENSPESASVREEMKKQADLSAVDEPTIKRIAHLETALREFVKQKKLSGLGILCWTAMQNVYGLSPCYTMGRLTDTGVMTSCEADIYGTLTMLIQYLASLGTSAPHFIDWTIKHQEEENVFLAWHCGNAPPSLACQKPGIKVSYHSIMGESLGIHRCLGTGEFQVKPGMVTLCRLIEREGQFKMLVSKGEIIPSKQDLRGAWGWVHVPDLNKLYTTLVREGFTHHASLIHGDYGRIIQDACRLLDVETVVV